MVRRKEIPKKKPTCAMKCNHCNANVDPSGPMSGLIMQIGPNLLVTCSDCGTQLAQMQNIIQVRWG